MPEKESTIIMIWPNDIDHESGDGEVTESNHALDTSEMQKLLRLYFAACLENATRNSHTNENSELPFEDWSSAQDASAFEADIKVGILNFLKVRWIRLFIKNKFREAGIPIESGKVEIFEQSHLPMIIIRCTEEFFGRVCECLKKMSEIKDFEISVSVENASKEKSSVPPIIVQT